MDLSAEAVLAFLPAHRGVVAAIVFVLAFGESLALVALFLPATAAMLGLGALIGAGGLEFWPTWAYAVAGAGLGDWASYWLGYYYREPVARLWPLSKYPAAFARGEAFFARWGMVGVFASKFFGPQRAFVPLAAGIARMPMPPFQLANWSSAAAWAFVTLAPGAFGMKFLALEF